MEALENGVRALEDVNWVPTIAFFIVGLSLVCGDENISNFITHLVSKTQATRTKRLLT